MKKTLLLGIIAPALFTGLAHGAITIFGTDNDGLGGFTTGATDAPTTPDPVWTTTTTGALFTNAPTGPVSPPDSGQVNSSLLRQYTLDRTDGSSYTLVGTVDLTSTYAGDNNRLGISLFSTSNGLAGIDTGLSLQVNLGAGSNHLQIRNGVNGGTFVTAASLSGVTAADLIAETLIYTAVIAFAGSDIEIDFTLSAPGLSYSQSISGTVVAANFTGDNFGFGSRGRVRSGNAAFIYEAKSFSVDAIPEPSSAAFIGLLGFMGLLRRHR